MVLQLHDTLQMIHHGYNSIEKGKQENKQTLKQITLRDSICYIHCSMHSSLFPSCVFNLLVKGTSYLMPIIIEAI